MPRFGRLAKVPQVEDEPAVLAAVAAIEANQATGCSSCVATLRLSCSGLMS